MIPGHDLDEHGEAEAQFLGRQQGVCDRFTCAAISATDTDESAWSKARILRSVASTNLPPDIGTFFYCFDAAAQEACYLGRPR